MGERRGVWGFGRACAAFVGTAALFAYYRSATFMGALFSAPGVDGEFASWSTSPWMPLAVLLFSVAAVLGAARLIPVEARKALALLSGPLGSLGAALALLARSGFLSEAWAMAGAALCALSFVYATVLSGRCLCAMDTARMVGTIVTGHAAAFAVFVVVRQTPAVQICALAVPMLATLPWLVCPQGDDGPGRRAEPGEGRAATLRRVLGAPVLWLLFILLTSSSAVRSLLGENQAPSVFRTLTCAALTATLVVAWGVGCAWGSRCRSGRDTTVLWGQWVCGGLLATVFLSAVFPYLSQGVTGGIYLAASSRSAFDALWLVAVCSTVGRKGLPRAALLIWGSAAWALQWLVCYWILPNLLFSGPAVSPRSIVSGAVILLALTALALCGLQMALMWRDARQPGQPCGDTVADDARRRLTELGLTPREVEVALLFSQGFSMKAVADSLGIEKGTVQSHSKAVYRKLDIHTKDELIHIVHDGAR